MTSRPGHSRWGSYREYALFKLSGENSEPEARLVGWRGGAGDEEARRASQVRLGVLQWKGETSDGDTRRALLACLVCRKVKLWARLAVWKGGGSDKNTSQCCAGTYPAYYL